MFKEAAFELDSVAGGDETGKRISENSQSLQ